MIYLIVGSVAVAALVAVYMAQPRFPPVIQSAAVFFRDQPVAVAEQRFSWSRPRPTPLFLLQLAIVLLLFLAILSYYFPRLSTPARQLGIWLIVDRSASMSTRQGTATRMDLALAELKRVAEWSWGVDRCFRMSALDLDLQTVQHDARTAAEVLHGGAGLTARALGTDLSIVQRVLGEPRGERAGGCRVDAIVTITDVAAPPWFDAAAGAVWIDVSQPVANIGLTDIVATRDQFDGRVERVRVHVATFGGMREASELVIERLGGGMRRSLPLQPWIEREMVREFVPDAPGRYRITVSPGGAYSYDDAAEIDVPAARGVRVDWRVENPDLPKRLGWSVDAKEADLSVVPAGAAIDERPTIIVGHGYRPHAERIQPIADFLDLSPLLNALNLDVAERAGISPAAGPPAGFEAVLRGQDGTTWLAQRVLPPAAFVPGLPLDGDDAVARFSAAVFFNAARWLLQRRPIAPLYRLTSPAEAEPRGNVIALHHDEGNTGRMPRSVGDIGELSLAAAATDRERGRIWPWLVLAAAVVFLTERWLAVFRGWR